MLAMSKDLNHIITITLVTDSFSDSDSNKVCLKVLKIWKNIIMNHTSNVTCNTCHCFLMRYVLVLVSTSMSSYSNPFFGSVAWSDLSWRDSLLKSTSRGLRMLVSVVVWGRRCWVIISRLPWIRIRSSTWPILKHQSVLRSRNRPLEVLFCPRPRNARTFLRVCLSIPCSEDK